MVRNEYDSEIYPSVMSPRQKHKSDTVEVI